MINCMAKKENRDMARLFVVCIVMVAIAQVAIAQPQPPLPVTIQGVVTYENGDHVPEGGNVSLWNLDEDYVNEPWMGKTGFFPPVYNYTMVGSATTNSTFKIDVQGDNYRGSETFDAAPFGFYVINITVSSTGVTPPPIIETPAPPVNGIWAIIGGVLLIVVVVIVVWYYKKKRL